MIKLVLIFKLKFVDNLIRFSWFDNSECRLLTYPFSEINENYIRKDL